MLEELTHSLLFANDNELDGKFIPLCFCCLGFVATIHIKIQPRRSFSAKLYHFLRNRIQLTNVFSCIVSYCIIVAYPPIIGQLPIQKRRNVFRSPPNLVRRWRYSPILPRSSTRPCAGTHEPIRRHSCQYWCFDVARQY